MHGRRVDRANHGYLSYTWIDLYIKYLIGVARKHIRLLPRVRYIFDYIFNHYHCKLLTDNHAEKILALEEDISVHPEDSAKVMPFEIANSIIISEPQSIMVLDCGCRLALGIKDEPINVCFVIGEPGASFCLEHGAKRLDARRIGGGEAMEIMRRERENGCIPTVWFMDVIGGRFYAICNCRPDRYAALEATRISRMLQVDDPPNIAVSSGYIAKVDHSLCNGCKACMKACPFEAITLNSEEKAAVAFDSCMGCGLCVDVCMQDALSIVRNERKSVNFDVEELV